MRSLELAPRSVQEEMGWNAKWAVDSFLDSKGLDVDEVGKQSQCDWVRDFALDEKDVEDLLDHSCVSSTGYHSA